MIRRLALLAGTALVGLVAVGMLVQPWRWLAALAPPSSPYVTQQTSPVRGLSAEEVDDLLNGRGAGFARTAELNSHPGPRHLLDLKDQLNLTPAQAAQIEAVFAEMQADAQRLGREIVAQERALSAAFATNALTPADLDARTAALARLYGELRAVHLAAHLRVTPLLSAEQIDAYNRLRGYLSAPAHPGAGQHQHQP